MLENIPTDNSDDVDSKNYTSTDVNSMAKIII
jgi:hypothetical protein